MGLRRIFVFSIMLASLPGCINPSSSGFLSSASSSPEAQLCGAVLDYSGSSNFVTITGIGQFEAYQVTSTGLGAVLTSPIRFAEVRVLDANQNVVQCGTTDNSGQVSLIVPKPLTGGITKAYTLEINSRAANTQIKASVLNDIYNRNYYSLTTSLSVTSATVSINFGTLKGLATGDTVGGAFNIFDQVLKANEYLRGNTTDSHCSGCQQFTVAPKVTIYWAKGVNPAGYLVSNAVDGTSFFDSSGSISNEPALFILGGIAGDVTRSDTDHFDNSVIIHEYAHFLEYTYAHPDSPGGVKHDGDLIIDPRVAWCEGWADFFSGVVLGIPYYRDTEGDNTYNRIIIDMSLEDPLYNFGMFDYMASNTLLGEGVFREVSVARTLWDNIDDTSTELTYNGHGGQSHDGTHNSFAYIWFALTSSEGFANSGRHFRSIGQFNEILATSIEHDFGIASTQNLHQADASLGEFQSSTDFDYGHSIVPSSTACPQRINPVDNQVTTLYDTGFAPNLFKSSRMYSFHHEGGPIQLSLSYSQTSSVYPSDLDLYLYSEDYRLYDISSIVGLSNHVQGLESPANSEQVSLSSLNSGYYMLQVIADDKTVSAGSGATFQIGIGATGGFLCPL